MFTKHNKMFGQNVKKVKALKIEDINVEEENTSDKLLTICAYTPPKKIIEATNKHLSEDCTMCSHYDSHYGICTLTHEFVDESSPMCRAYLPYIVH